MSGITKQKRKNKKISEARKEERKIKVEKLKEAFAIGANIKEACYYAEIHVSTYYDWIEKNPKLSDEFEDMRQRLPLKAKQNIASGLEKGDIPLSERYLAKQQPDEYGERLKIDLNSDKKDDTEAIDQFHKQLTDNRKKRSQEKAKKEGEI